MAKQITTTISEEFHQAAQDFNLQWSEALRIGIALLLMERGQNQFQSPLNAQRIKSLGQKLGLKLEHGGESKA